ncbi:PKD domain-containing protein [Alteromonas facilis]|uniref:PKD domain-containing protein n=1 Tax=Alteromonas facilis TaxID=2048004 RepID=UPI000C288F53|nr:zinc-dependent metalloprotease family protein [Alteromonas facilis]
MKVLGKGWMIGLALLTTHYAHAIEKILIEFDSDTLAVANSVELSRSTLFSDLINQQQFSPSQPLELSINGDFHSLQVAENSKPDKGFYRLEMISPATGMLHNVGHIVSTDSTTLTVIKLPNQPKLEIVERNGQTTVRKAIELQSDPLEIPKASIKALPEPINLKHIVNPNDITGGNQTTTVGSMNEPESHGSLDVLLIYDPRILGAYVNEDNVSSYDLLARIASADALINSVFERSSVGVTHNIVGILPVSDAPSEGFPTEDSSSILSWMWSSEKIKRLKDRYKADMVHFIGAQDTQVCGRAYYGNTISSTNQYDFTSFNALAGYSRLVCLGNGTYAHEVGHNLGLRHDRLTLSGGSIGGGSQIDFHIPYGYIEPEGDFYTTMAYGSSCREIGDSVNCSDEAVYSSPDILFNETPMGKSDAEQDAADGSRSTRMTAVATARLDSYSRMQSLTQIVAQNGEFTLSWPTVEGATDYRILSYNCTFYNYTSRGQFENSLATANNQLTFDRFSEYADNTCVFARFVDESGTPSYALVGETSLNYQSDGTNSDYLYPDTTILNLFNPNDQQSITLTLSNPNTDNSDIKLAIALTENGGTADIVDAISEADTWFDYQVTGSGEERNIDITLKENVDVISSLLSDTDQRNPFDLPIRIVNTAFENYDVFNTIYLDPQGELPELLTYYFSNSPFLIELESVSGEFVVMGLSESDNVTVTQASTPQMTDFEYAQSFAQTDFGNQTTIQFSGKAPIVEGVTPLMLQIEVTDSGYLPQLLEYSVVPEVIPPAIENITGKTVIIGDDAHIVITVSDRDQNINWATPTLEIIVGTTQQGDDIIEVYGAASFDVTASTATFTIPGLEIGEYPITISVFDEEGNSVTETDTLVVQENQAPLISEISVSPEDIVETRIFSLSAEVTDPEDEALTLQWSTSNGSDVEIVTPNSASTQVNGLSPGSYEFELTATDPRGASTTQSVNVVVNQNQAPVVSTSVNPSAPTTSQSITLRANATDNDGEIVELEWSQTSGASVSIPDNTQASITLGTLAAGSYTFSVAVTDDLGAVTTSSLTFSVITPPPPGSNSGDSSGGSSTHLMLLALSMIVYCRRRLIAL